MESLYYYIISGSCGLTVGASELLSRYKSFKYVFFSNKYGWIYICINIMMSILVYHLIETYNLNLGQLGTKGIGRSLFAGFSAMAFLRSSFFNFRDSNDKVVEIGPSYVLTVFLRVAEKEFSQILARNIVKKSAEIMKGIPFLSAARELPLIILSSYKVFTPEEQTILSKDISALRDDVQSNESVKNIALGALLERYSGIRFLTVAVDELKSIYDEQQKKKDEIEEAQQSLSGLKY